MTTFVSIDKENVSNAAGLVILTETVRLACEPSEGGFTVDDNEVQVATLYGRIIIACLAILVAFWQLDVPVPVIP